MEASGVSCGRALPDASCHATGLRSPKTDVVLGGLASLNLDACTLPLPKEEVVVETGWAGDIIAAAGNNGFGPDGAEAVDSRFNAAPLAPPNTLPVGPAPNGNPCLDFSGTLKTEPPTAANWLGVIVCCPSSFVSVPLNTKGPVSELCCEWLVLAAVLAAPPKTLPVTETGFEVSPNTNAEEFFPNTPDFDEALVAAPNTKPDGAAEVVVQPGGPVPNTFPANVDEALPDVSCGELETSDD